MPKLNRNLKSDCADSPVRRNCLLCGNAFAVAEDDDRVCSPCRAQAAGGVGMDQGRRRHLRVDVDMPVKFRDDSGAHAGKLTNLSYSGAAVETVSVDFGRKQVVALESDAIGVLSGPVVRTFYGGFAISFDMDEEAKSPLLEWVAGYRNDAAED